MSRMERIISKKDFDIKELKVATDVLCKLREKIGINSGNAANKQFEPDLFDYQREFVECDSRYSAMIGGVRSGKTYSGTVKGLQRALLLPTVGAVVAPTSAMARDVLMPQYAELAGGRVIKWNSSIGDMILDNGSKILFRSGDKPERLMGLTLDWFHLDEASQVESRVWEVLINRTISTGGPGFFTTTPRGRNWVYRMIKKWAENEECQVFYAKTSDNPLIDKKNIERAREQMDARYFRQQFEASFEVDGLRVYDDFRSDRHVLSTPWNVIDDWPIYIGIDFGWTHPTAIIWAQLSPEGRWYIFDELVESHMRPEKLAEAINGDPVDIGGRSFRAKVDYKRVARVISGKEGHQSRQEAGGRSALINLSSMGINRLSVNNYGLMDGVHAVRAKLLSAGGEINLKIDPGCRRVIDDFMGYNYPADDSGKPIGEVPEKDDIHDHSMDAIRYMIGEISPLTRRDWHFG